MPDESRDSLPDLEHLPDNHEPRRAEEKGRAVGLRSQVAGVGIRALDAGQGDLPAGRGAVFERIGGDFGLKPIVYGGWHARPLTRTRGKGTVGARES